MIKYIQEQGESMVINIIPKLTPYNEISLSPGDTLVAFIDSQKWDMNDAQEFYRLLRKTFPNNNICIMFDGVELGVVRNAK